MERKCLHVGHDVVIFSVKNMQIKTFKNPHASAFVENGIDSTSNDLLTTSSLEIQNLLTVTKVWFNFSDSLIGDSALSRDEQWDADV